MSVLKAKRKYFQMPVTILCVNNQLFVTETSSMNVYTKLIELIKNKEFASTAPLTNAKSLLEEILAVSENEAEKARLKYAVTSLLNVSAREVLEKFGIKRLSQRAEKFKEASKKVKKNTNEE